MDPKEVAAERAKEIWYVRKHEVYKKVKRSSVHEGTKIIQVRWIDINKGDETNPNIRCRLVAKDFNTEEKPELFAGTPPLEALRIICSEPFFSTQWPL